MGVIPLNKGEMRDVEIINRAMERLVKREITFHCMDEEILLLRGDKNTDDYGNGYEEGMPNQDAIVTRLDVTCEAGGW